MEEGEMGRRRVRFSAETGREGRHGGPFVVVTWDNLDTVPDN